MVDLIDAWRASGCQGFVRVDLGFALIHSHLHERWAMGDWRWAIAMSGSVMDESTTREQLTLRVYVPEGFSKRTREYRGSFEGLARFTFRGTSLHAP